MYLLLEIINWSKILYFRGNNHNVVPVFDIAINEDVKSEILLQKTHESTVNIITRQAIVIEVSEPLRWNGYGVLPVVMTMTNSGDTGINQRL